MAVCLAISEIFSVKEWCDLENQVRGRSRSLNGGPSLLENIRNAITRLPMHRLGRNLGGRISSCSQWICYFSSYDGTGWYDSLVVASKQHLCCKTVSLVLVVTANRTVNVLVLWGVEIKKSTLLMKLGWLCHCGIKIKSGIRKQQILIQKTLEVLSLLRPIVHWHI